MGPDHQLLLQLQLTYIQHGLDREDVLMHEMFSEMLRLCLMCLFCPDMCGDGYL